MKTALLFSGLGDPATHAVLQRIMAQDSPLIKQALRASNCSADNTEYAVAQMGKAAAKFESDFWAGLETGTQLLDNLA